MYSVAGYGAMLADRVRMDAYHEALRRTVRPGSVVADVGAGPGVLSCIAVQLGASLVHAIEPSAILEVGKSIARVNGLENRIVFHRAFSDSVSLAEPADVVVADLRSVLPAFGSSLKSMIDARVRLLKPEGTI